MKICCGRNGKGTWKASLDESKLNKFEDVFESEVEAVHNDKVYMIEIYRGFDYGTVSMYDVINVLHKAFHSVSAAKKSETWKNAEDKVKENPNDYHVTPFSIASDDGGEPFVWGDVMSGKFNMKIISVRVI